MSLNRYHQSETNDKKQSLLCMTNDTDSSINIQRRYEDIEDENHNTMYHEYVSKREETKILFAIAWPVAVSSFCRLVMAVTDVAVLGYLENGTEYLAAASLASVVMDMTIALPESASNALNQLCAQAYGAKNFELVGRWLQLGLLVTFVMCIPIMIVWCFAGKLLMLIGTSSRLAHLANQFCWISIIGVLPNNFYYAIRQYFQAQKIVKPALYNNLVFVVLNLLLNIMFVHGLHLGSFHIAGLGFIGSPLATAVSRTLQPIAFVMYTCVYKRLHVPTWPTGPFFGAFTRKRLKEFSAQSVPTMIGTAAEEWQLEIITLMAARLGTVDLATQSSTFNVFYTLHCFAFGLAKATTCRVGYHLGAGRAAEAKQASIIAFAMSSCVGVVIGVLLYACRDWIGRIFSNDPAVWMQASRIALILSFGYLGCSWLISFTATLFGQGRPAAVAIIGGLCSWILSLPLAYWFAFYWKLTLRGLWYGLVCGYVVFCIAAAALVLRSDWQAYAQRAVQRAELTSCLLSTQTSERDTQQTHIL